MYHVSYFAKGSQYHFRKIRKRVSFWVKTKEMR